MATRLRWGGPVALVIAALCGLILLSPSKRGSARERRSAARLDVPFTLAVKTPHVPWGKPSPGAPVRAFVVPSVSEGRTLVELAERMDLTFDTVAIDEAWDVNTWTIGTEANYEARNYKLAYRYLEEDLTGAKSYDVIILPSLHGWNRLPLRVREAIRRRVQEGTGLVLIHPTTGVPAPDDPPTERPMNDFAPDYEVSADEDLWELSPLVGVLSDRLTPRGHREVRPDATAAGPWKRVAPHFITDNVPFESFPTDYLKHYKYRAPADGTVLVASAQGAPIVATRRFGKGRVVALGYVNTGLSPMINWEILGKTDDRWWEYFYSLLCRSILWAAQREPALRLGALTIRAVGEKKELSIQVQNAGPAVKAGVTAQMWDEWGKDEGKLGASLELGPGANSAALALPPPASAGRHYVDVVLSADGKHHDWGTVSFELEKPEEILNLATDRTFYARGDRVQFGFETRSGRASEFVVELTDNRGRLIGRSVSAAAPDAASPLQAVVEVGNYSTNIGWARVTLLDGQAPQRVIDRKQVRVNFVNLDREFGAYEFIMPWYGPPSYQPWTPTLDEQFRKVGVTVAEDSERNFKLISEAHAPGLGVYWHYRQKYLGQKDKFLETGDKRYLVREPDIADDGWLEQLREAVRQGMKKDKPFRPLAYYLADESSLTSYGDPFDLSWSQPTLAKFRAWLQTQYSNLNALNEEWETKFASWDEVVPLTTAEAQAKGNYGGWMDHRTFMEQVFAKAVAVAAEAVKREDPDGLASLSGTQVPGPSNAVNWYLLDQVVDYLQPYSDDDQDDLHRSMRPGLLLTGFTGYERRGKVLRHELWTRLLHGHVGASLFWHYTALNPDLTLTEQGRDLAETIDEFRNEGLALLLRGAERENSGIAVHYSLLSVRGQWITDGRIHPHEVSNGDATSAHLKRFHENRHAWVQALTDAGYQFDFLTTEQITQGKLAGYKVLILPDSIALADEEVTAMGRFVGDGGLLVADVETGLMDGHGRWQAAGRLDDLLGVQRSDERSAPDALRKVRLRITTERGVARDEVMPAGSSLKTTDGRPRATAGGVPFLIESQTGSGHARTLNFWMADYPRLRQAQGRRARLALIHDMLAPAGVRPVVNVRKSNGVSLACSEIVAFRRGSAEFLAILPEPKCTDVGKVTVELAAARHVYDLRAHRPLGRLSRVSGMLVAGEPLLYALLPAPLGQLSVDPAHRQERLVRVRAGAIVRFTVRLGTQAGYDAPPSAVHVEVRNPAGTLLEYYTQNLPVTNGAAEFALPLALDDEPGQWRVTVREPYTHQTAGADFLVER